MSNFFIKIYQYFSQHKLVMWLILISSTILMTLASIKVRYVEDITNFFPKQEHDISLIFDNIKAKDKFVVMFTAKQDGDNIDSLISCAEDFSTEINKNEYFRNNASLSMGVNDSIVESMLTFVYDNLPLFLNDNDYDRLDSLVSKESIAQKMKHNYDNLLSPMGGYISDYIYKDPLGLGSNALKELQNQGNNFKYSVIDNYIFSSDKKTLICYIDPNAKIDNKGKEKLVDLIELSLQRVNDNHTNITSEYFGAAAVATYNARQIKTDSMVTLNIAILIVIIFITLAFRNKYSILLVLTPVIYGGIFALSIIYLISGEISLIAVGSGSIIFGIALSYSIHILSHTNHCRDIKQLISELAYPLTIGSFTTIGAFAGLLFTNSKLLQDFGLFSSLTLIGTTLFALIFLPHFLDVKKNDKPENRLLSFVDKISNIHFDRNKIFVWSVVILTIITALFFNNVGFDSNMMNLNFEPPHLKAAEDRLNLFTENKDNVSTVLFIASSDNPQDAINSYDKLCSTLNSLQNKGKIASYSSINSFVVSDLAQQQRLDRWRSFWSNGKQEEVLYLINSEAGKLGFDDGAFSNFNTLITRDYQKVSYDNGTPSSQLFADWVSTNKSITSFIAQVKLSSDNKSDVYELVSQQKGVLAVDRAFFASKMAQDVSHNFYLILYISGLLIFLALLLSYGRLELTLISFLPMFISWVIILGIMQIFGIEFNIVTIILSTFIFGIGDDFSIFIMDGLQNEYRDKTQVLSHHKTAIFFSAFTIIVGMGALVFAKHPAMQSLGLISLIGIVVVVIIAYSIQPYIFRAFISSQTNKGGFPFTILSLLNTIYAFGLFAFGCFVIKVIILLSYLIPIGETRRKVLIHRVTSWSTHAFLRVTITTKMININDVGETFQKPAVIIANHQSFIDILLLLGLHHKLVMITNGWVWRSMFFGRIVRYLDFYHTENGYESLVDSLKEKVENGYSIIVFPEGTRSADLKIKRFHKGAFYLAEKLKLDILPILIYGSGLVSSKTQPLYIKNGVLVSKILPRISLNSTDYGIGYKEQTKGISKYIKEEYLTLYEEFNRISKNRYFKDAIIKNYIYKGPVLEWYMRVKLKMEGWYETYDLILPRQGHIVDLGCGYGAMSYMLSMLSENRSITAVDYDEKKIALANNCLSKNDNIRFIYADIREYDIPCADGYVISDVLHYLDYQSQKIVIQRCIDNLNKGGVIIIRDGDTSIKEKHARTENTEEWSTQILKFNKTDGPLCFMSRELLLEIAKTNSMNMEIIENNSKTSNTLFIFTRKY
ncbi:MAG: 1-acyl-sn-glycerol-3-phosphate acyltransferase [Rikenellaceae bacterium]